MDQNLPFSALRGGSVRCGATGRRSRVRPVGLAPCANWRTLANRTRSVPGNPTKTLRKDVAPWNLGGLPHAATASYMLRVKHGGVMLFYRFHEKGGPSVVITNDITGANLPRVEGGWI